MNWRLEVASENGLILYIVGDDKRVANGIISEFAAKIASEAPAWLHDYIPSYTSLLLIFDLSIADHFLVRDFMISRLEPLLETGAGRRASTTDTITLPVWYGGGEANDLERVSSLTGLSPQALIQLHTSQRFRVFAIGFSPGFAFMGELPDAMQVPRLDTPRTKVPAGAVGITGAQTAVYPFESPGGWNLIGLCPTPLFDFATATSVLKIGDEVTFTSIDEQTYRELRSV